MGEVKWIKITTNIFDDEKIRVIETMPDGDTIIVIWFKLLCLAGKANENGYIMMNEEVAYTEDMLVALFNRPILTVQLALKTFKQFKMIELVDDILCLPNWEKHQNVAGLDKIRLQNKERQQRYRNKQKNLRLENKEKEEDIEKDRYSNATVTLQKNDIIGVLNYLNKKIGKSYKLTNDTKTKINARYNEGFTYDDFISAIDNAYNHWSKSGDYKNMKPSTLFNGKFESRVNGDAYGWVKETKAKKSEYVLECERLGIEP